MEFCPLCQLEGLLFKFFYVLFYNDAATTAIALVYFILLLISGRKSHLRMIRVCESIKCVDGCSR